MLTLPLLLVILVLQVAQLCAPPERWKNLTIGNQVGQELYDQRLDTGVSASSFSTFETANLAQSADPALLRNLSSMLHQLVAAQRK